MEDRRNARRYSLQVPLQVTLSGAGKSVEGETRDLSSRGLFFFVPQPVESGAPIEFVVTLPAMITGARDLRVQCAGHVQRVDKAKSNSFGVAAVIDRFDFLPAPS